MLQAQDKVDLASTARTQTVSSTVEVTKGVVEIEVAVAAMAVVVEVMTSEVATGEEEVIMARVVISEEATGTAIPE